MAVNIETQHISTLTMTTVLNTLESFTATIPVPGLIPEGQQTLLVPGVVVQGGDPQFLEGYGNGRDYYFSDVEDTINPDGTPYQGGFTLEDVDTGRVLIRKVRDLTIEQMMTSIRVMMNEEQIPLEARIGAVVGYVAACVEEFYGLACPVCGRPTQLCQHCCSEGARG
jgi:hypothetical protein